MYSFIDDHFKTSALKHIQDTMARTQQRKIKRTPRGLVLNGVLDGVPGVLCLACFCVLCYLYHQSDYQCRYKNYVWGRCRYDLLYIISKWDPNRLGSKSVGVNRPPCLPQPIWDDGWLWRPSGAFLGGDHVPSFPTHVDKLV